jgi:hypothetical protein
MAIALNRTALLTLALVGPSCDVLAPSCSLIPCLGLVVEVSNAPSLTPITIVLTATDGSTRSGTATCAGNTCSLSFPDFTPPTVTIQVTAGTESSEVTTQPAYQTTRPNGPRCPPECRTARVEVAL